jgi:hypothetical protein
VTLRSTGEFEVLKPLARWKAPTNFVPTAGNILVTKRKRSVVAGSPPPARAPLLPDRLRRQLTVRPAFIIIVTILVAGFYLGIFVPKAGQTDDVDNAAVAPINVPGDRPVENMLPTSDEPSSSDLALAETSPFAFEAPDAVHVVLKRRPARSHALVADYLPPEPALQPTQPQIEPLQAAIQPPRPQPLHSQFWLSEFVPTTLVIYIENDEVKTRIDPWLPAANKKPIPN